jgi:hypothetical protein
MDPTYRYEANLLLLQSFGLGAKRVGSGELRSIPTHFQISDWPNPTTEGQRPDQSTKPQASGAEEVTWKVLLPLLQK